MGVTEVEWDGARVGALVISDREGAKGDVVGVWQLGTTTEGAVEVLPVWVVGTGL